MELVVHSEDLTPEERQSLIDYHSNGCPGLTKIDETTTFKWFELYMSGKTYSEIASITNSKKDLILYISNRLKWNDKRMKYLEDINNNILQKTQRAKIETANTVLAGVSALGKYYGKKFNNYLATNDEEVIQTLDTKLLQSYFKCMETLDKLVPEAVFNPDNKQIAPNVTVNVTSPSASVTANPDGSVDIEDNMAENILRTLANIKKSKEQEKK